MHDLATIVVSATRKRLFGQKPVFESHGGVSEADIVQLERSLNCAVPSSLRDWLLQMGYGDLNEELSFRKDWFNVIDRGNLKGHVSFAMDILGNLYTFDPEIGAIHFLSRSASEYAEIAPDFRSFMEGLIKHNYKLAEWVDGLALVREYRNA